MTSFSYLLNWMELSLLVGMIAHVLPGFQDESKLCENHAVTVCGGISP
jgi:hypothetical protein